jgi:amidase
VSKPDTLIRLSAVNLAALIRRKEISAREVLDAHLRQVDRMNPRVNAIVTLDAEEAMRRAEHADREIAHGRFLGPLHGLPIAHKDLLDTAGMRTTYGSPIFRDHVPDRDARIVARLRRCGAIAFGKTNTPEFGAGSQTFNPIFGATRNPYDLGKTCGGSSGGSAVALACGMMPIADGSDTGGSLRNPASFCSVVGLRPSSRHVVRAPMSAVWNELTVVGPMARSAEDVALVFRALTSRTFPSLLRDFRNVPIAWAPKLAGLPFDPAVTEVFSSRRSTFEAMGCVPQDASPELPEADAIFRVIRASGFYRQYGSAVLRNRALVKETVLAEVERGAAVTNAELLDAKRKRARLRLGLAKFMQRYEFLVLPTAQVPPFPIHQQYVTEVAGVPMESYIDWMRSCYFISITGHPAASVPAGFTPEGLPVGLQIVGRPGADWEVLQLAHAFELARGPLPPLQIQAS